MKVLHIIWSSNIGGIESVVLNLALSQNKSESIKASIFAAKSDGTLIDKASENNIEILKGNFSKGRLNISKLISCIKIFRNFDILHIHSFNPIIAIAATLTGKKIVYTEHGNFGFERKLSKSELKIKKLQKYFLNKQVNHITCNSHFTRKMLLEFYDVKESDASVIYNGINLPQIKNDSYKKAEVVRIGFVGRLVEVKKIERIVEALSKLSNKDKIKFDVVGDGPLRFGTEMIVIMNDIEDQTTFWGFQNDLQKFYSNWDLLIAPSANEAFGLVAIEAYSYGCPVAAFTDGGGLTELVNKCESGFVFDTTDQLKDFIESLIKNDNSTINETNQRIHRRAFASEFTIEKMKDQLSKVYLSL